MVIVVTDSSRVIPKSGLGGCGIQKRNSVLKSARFGNGFGSGMGVELAAFYNLFFIRAPPAYSPR